MSAVHFVADLHIGHRLVAGIRGFGTPVPGEQPGRRPRYVDVDTAAHDETVHQNWCDRVVPDDVVWVLGDLAVVSSRERVIETLTFIAGLPGRKRFIAGNHDPVHPMHRDSWKWMSLYMATFESVQVFARASVGAKRVLLSHFPYANDARHSAAENGGDKYAQYRLPDLGQWLVHGHTHSTTKQRAGSREICVSLDAWGMRPARTDEVERLITSADKDRRGNG